MAPPRKRYCKHGHDMLIYAVTEIRKTPAGGIYSRRYCSECHKNRLQASYQKKREKQNESRNSQLPNETSN